MSDYDRRTPRPVTAAQVPTHSPGEADDALGKAYHAILAFKNGFDQMEEIPSQYLPTYRQAMKALDVLTQAQRETYQLRMMARRLPG